jgi:hypothetical protein
MLETPQRCSIRSSQRPPTYSCLTPNARRNVTRPRPGHCSGPSPAQIGLAHAADESAHSAIQDLIPDGAQEASPVSMVQHDEEMADPAVDHRRGVAGGIEDACSVQAVGNVLDLRLEVDQQWIAAVGR